MKTTKKCPKCQSNEIYTNIDEQHGYRTKLGIDGWKSFSIDSYVCMQCGYLEEYLSDEDFKDQKKKAKLMEHWTKI